MTDVFVNYRHGDGHGASRLQERLDDAFDVFMDVHLEAGDSLNREIMLALSEARVVLAVIGPSWKKQTDRLRDRNDWIRRELLVAFEQPGTRVLPVLLDVPMPKEDEIPPELIPLLDPLAAELRFNSWDADVDTLIQKIGKLLHKPPQQTAASDPMPLDLPYLCNRVTQEDDLAELAAAQLPFRSMVCVVHGHKWEAHAGFVSRLRQLCVLEDLFCAGKDGIDTYQLVWNPNLAKAGQHGRALRSALKRSVLKERGASDEKLSAYLRNTARPAVMELQITDAVMKECGESLLLDFHDAWVQIIAELGTVPIHFLVLWLNLTYEDPAGDLPPGFSGPALAKLTPVDGNDIYTWMNLDEVRRFIVLRETAVSDLASEQSMWVAPELPRIHMQKFVDAVRILTQITKRRAG